MLNEYGLVTDSIIDPSAPINSMYKTFDVEIDFREPEDMLEHHWHGEIEINIPYGGDVTYLINQVEITLFDGYAGIFWATTPHKLVRTNGKPKMAIIYVPLQIFLTWQINKTFLRNVINGEQIHSKCKNIVSSFEVERWCNEIHSSNECNKLLAIEEISIFLRRFILTGWHIISTGLKNTNKYSSYKHIVSTHARYHVQMILTYIAENYHSPLTLNLIANHVQLHPNYAISIFQKVMHLSIKEYITQMRVQHAKALLVETERSILDIAMAVGFQSTSRFYASFKKLVNHTPSAYRQMSK